MASLGIPPSPDQIVIRRQKFFVVVVGVTVFVAIVGGGGLWSTLFEDEIPFDPASFDGAANPTEAESAEAERLSAYRAVQFFAEERLKLGPVETVFWRDNTHWVAFNEYHFKGVMDVRYDTTAVDRFDFEISVLMTGYRQWELSQMIVGNKDYMAAETDRDKG